MMVEYTGEDLADHHGVSAIISDGQGNILMQEHVKYGFWTIPIGKVAIREDVVEGIRQEVLEECGITAEKIVEVMHREFFYERGGRKQKIITYLFAIMTYSGTPTNKEPLKHRQQIFMSVDDIQKLSYLSDATVLFLESLGIHRKSHL
jgi:ADP-ribose pyrophosphatase YjhB (NUDIX family)